MAERASVEETAVTDPRAPEMAHGMRTEDFDYPLDEGLIAQRPLPERDASRLLQVRRSDSAIRDGSFRDLVQLIAANDVVVLNETRVFPARLLGYKPSGAAAEILLLHPIDQDRSRWRALVRPGGKLKPGRVVEVGEDLDVEILDSTDDGARVVRLLTSLTPDEAVARYGRVPLPPYIRREDDDSDRARYQTVYAQERGSVAAPTAGLHFTEDMIGAIRSRGIEIARLTLHVGPGTFRPVDVDDPTEHRLEAERYRVEPTTAETINRCREAGGAVWAVGTTTVRTLETVADSQGNVEPAAGNTELFIRPGFQFQVVDRIVTNFHLPRSTLLMLVAAFAGYDLTMDAYRHAMEQNYRFYSYGDAMVVI
jgi:S-adenosylmethionine:tRNA ribosyltransferase-isomerase